MLPLASLAAWCARVTTADAAGVGVPGAGLGRVIPDPVPSPELNGCTVPLATHIHTSAMTVTAKQHHLAGDSRVRTFFLRNSRVRTFTKKSRVRTFFF